MCVIFLGILAVGGFQFTAAGITLTAHSDKVVENTSLVLTCSYTGKGFRTLDIILNSKVKLSLRADCTALIQPNIRLYEYLCLNKTEFLVIWTIKQVTRANEGDTWICQALSVGEVEISIYDLSIHYGTPLPPQPPPPSTTSKSAATEPVQRTETQTITEVPPSTTRKTVDETGSIDSTTNNSTIIVGATLGLFSFVVVVYATIVTVLLKRKTAKNDTEPLQQSKHDLAYVNVEDNGVVTKKSGTGHGTNEIEEDPDKYYTSLNPLTKDDMQYECIQTQSF